MSIARHLLADAPDSPAGALLTPQELLAGSLLVHEVVVPAGVLHPGGAAADDPERRVRVRPLKVATLALTPRLRATTPRWCRC